METKFALPFVLLASQACAPDETTFADQDVVEIVEQIGCGDVVEQISLAIHLKATDYIDWDGVVRDVDVLNREFAPIVGSFTVDSIDYFEPQIGLNFVDGTVDVFYSSRGDGDPLGRSNHPDYTTDGVLLNEGFIQMYVEPDGRSMNDYVLSHEMGHTFSLKHPYEGSGDGIFDTIDYGVVCGSDENTFVYEVFGVCVKACLDGSYAAPNNIMNVDDCRDPEDGTQWSVGFSQTQLEVMACDMYSPSGPGFYINN